MQRNTSSAALVAYAILLIPLTAALSLASITNQDSGRWVFALMFAPTVSALLAWPLSGVRPRFGRFGWRGIVFGIGLVAVASLGYPVTATTGAISSNGLQIPWEATLRGLIPSIVLALGEELGWRGYLLPQLRRVLGFWGANMIVAGVWFIYHLPVILWGPYAPADRPLGVSLLFFVINIVLFSFTVGALWEITHDVWMPAIAHGCWNLFIAGALPAMFDGSPPWLLGEFGFVPTLPLVIALAGALLLSRGHRPRRLELTKTRLGSSN